MSKPGVYVVDVYKDHMDHGRRMCHDLEKTVKAAFLPALAGRMFARFETREYVEETKTASAGYYVRSDSHLPSASVANSEILGHVTFTITDDAILPSFKVVKNQAVIGEGTGVIDWCKFLRDQKALATWVEV